MSGWGITYAGMDRAFEKHGRKPFRDRAAHMRAVRHEINAAGYRHIQAHHDQAGNCIYCGESGRCPGVHAEIEISRVMAGQVTP